MVSKSHTVFGSASWITRFGNSFNSNVSPAKATSRGGPLWSVTLPERRADGIAVAEDGCCFVNLDNHLLAVEPGGRIRWTAQANYALSSPVVLADRLVIYEEHALKIREQATGKILTTLPSYYATVPAVTPRGNLVYSATENEKGPAQLQMTTLAGERLWTVPVVHNPYRPPLILNDLIVVADKFYMKAFNLEGELQWIADQEGFILASPNTRAQLAQKSNPIKQGWEDRVVSPIVWLGEERLLAGIEWSGSSGYYIFNLHQHTVWPLDTHLPLIKEPLAVPLLPKYGPCLVTRGRSVGGKLNMQQSTIVMVDMNGQMMWEHQLPIRPSAIIADASAKIFLICSPSFDRWDKYRDWYKLEEECFVRGLSSDGQELFTWYAPGPISPPMAIGKQGELYVIAEGKLWAIG